MVNNGDDSLTAVATKMKMRMFKNKKVSRFD